jgi:predicted TIM-barrel fold metal-dependent hydrolase
MDTGTPSNPSRPLPTQLAKNSDTRDVLARAAMQKRQKGLEDYLIVDVDAHHYETQSWHEIVPYIPDPVVRDIANNFRQNGRLTPGIINTSSWPSHQGIGGRLAHDGGFEEDCHEDGVHRDVVVVRRAIESLGIDYQVLFPTPMLGLGMHPELDVEINVAHGYNRWLCENVLPQDDRIKTLLYMPFNDPQACEKFIEEFGEKKGVVGFMVTSVRYKPVHHNSYMRMYGMMQERGMPLAFHGGPFWGASEGFLRQVNRFLSAHALSFPLSNMVHMANWVMNGLCEKFPKLPIIWIEGGIAWMAFMTQRFDNEYLMRSSEAPALKRLPSEYMREMYYTSQPLERTNMELLEATFNSLNASTQLLYASDWPHWDFDVPSTITDLPFLNEQDKRNILGLNAQRIFKL